MKTVLSLSLLLSAFAFTQEAKAIQVGEEAPCYVLNHISPNGADSEHCIRDAGKGQAKILEFFSTTCSACAENLPLVSGLAKRLDGRAVTRLVSIDRNEQQVRTYVKAKSDLIRFEVALDSNKEAYRAYDVIHTPTVFVLDSKDKVLFRHQGVLSVADLKTIENLVETRR